MQTGGYRNVHCADCGTVVRRVLRADRDPLCAECACARQTRAAVQQRAHNGEAWQRRAEAMIAWADGGGIDRTDQGAKWKAAKRREVNRLREMVGELPRDVSPIAN